MHSALVKKRVVRAQISIFIVIGLLILVLIAFGIFLNKADVNFNEKIMHIPSALEPVKYYIDFCLKQTVEDGVKHNSFQGGYYNVPSPNADQIIVKVPFYFDFGKTNFPSKEVMKKELEDYVETELKKCLNDFTPLKQQGYIFEEKGEINVKAELGKVINVQVDYPLLVKKEGFVGKISDFSNVLNINFEDVYNILKETVIEHEKNPNYVPIGHISLAAHENNFTFELSYLEDDVVVYSFIFDKYLIKGDKLVFLFGAKYDWSDLKVNEKDKEIIGVIKDIRAKDQYCYVGDVCRYDLNIYDDKLNFEDYTSLFDISSDGVIEFVPKQSDVAEHNILIKVSNKSGKEKYLTFTLEIIPFNNQPQIEEIPKQKAKVGQIFSYQIIAEDPDDDVFVFLDDTDLFDISYDGLISFIPEKKDIGMHIIKITISDGKLENNKWMYLTIEE